jgi:hypothetical protein
MLLRSDAPGFHAAYAEAKRSLGTPTRSSVVGVGHSHNVVDG